MRIEYSFYHTMNHSEGEVWFFMTLTYCRAFLDILGKVHKYFYAAVIHAYCLTGNNYHLLIEVSRVNKGIEFYKM